MSYRNLFRVSRLPLAVFGILVVAVILAETVKQRFTTSAASVGEGADGDGQRQKEHHDLFLQQIVPTQIWPGFSGERPASSPGSARVGELSEHEMECTSADSRTASNQQPMHQSHGSLDFQRGLDRILRIGDPSERRKAILDILEEETCPRARSVLILNDLLEDEYFAAEAWQLLQRYGLEDEVVLGNCGRYLRGRYGGVVVQGNTVIFNWWKSIGEASFSPNHLAWILYASRSGSSDAVRAAAWELLSGELGRSASLFHEITNVAEKDVSPAIRIAAIRSMWRSGHPDLLCCWSRILQMEQHPRVLVELIVLVHDRFPGEAELLVKPFLTHENRVVRHAAKGKLGDIILSGQGLSMDMLEYDEPEQDDNSSDGM